MDWTKTPPEAGAACFWSCSAWSWRDLTFIRRSQTGEARGRLCRSQVLPTVWLPRQRQMCIRDSIWDSFKLGTGADLLDILVRSVFRSFPGKNDSWTGRGLPHEWRRIKRSAGVQQPAERFYMILIIQWSAMFDPAHNLNTKNPKHGDHNVKCRGKTNNWSNNCKNN